MQNSTLTLCRGQEECHPCQGMKGFMHQLHASSLGDVDETDPDTLSHAGDRMSDTGHMLQGGAGAVWRQGTRTRGVLGSLAAGMGFAPGEGSTAP